MSRYSGRRIVRGRVVVALVAFTLALGFGAGALLSDDKPTRVGTVSAPPCPGSRGDATERARAAACLLVLYLSSSGPSSRKALRNIVLPGTTTERPGTASAPVNGPGELPRYASVVAEYSSVVAIKAGTGLRPGTYAMPDVGFTAWVASVDSFADGTAPLANWYLGHFSIRWYDNRWWLTDGFTADRNATPRSLTAGTDSTAFGPGWVTVQ